MMKINKICRTCLLEKSGLKPLFGSCLSNMLMTCATIQVMEGDGMPQQICTQCLQMVNRAYSFKQQCEKSDEILRQYLSTLNVQNVSLVNEHNILSNIKNDHLFAATEVIQQSSTFSDIFNDNSTPTLVDNFSTHNPSAVVSDFAETMHNLQTITEQCLSETWESESELIKGANKINLENFYKCHFCSETHKDEWSLIDHMQIHTTHSKYFCTVCGAEFNAEILFNKHSSLHSDILSNNITDSNVTGEPCKNISPSKKNLKEVHLNQNFEKKNHACTVCSKSYKQKKHLVIHLRTHTGERPLSCEVCRKTFSLPSSLYKHRLIHATVKKHKCNVCEKKFRYPSSVKIHMRTHTAEKPYVCNTCGKACTTNVNLRIHMRIHSGEKPYACNTCDALFATGSQLKKHVMRHTGEKPHECWHCGKTFRQKDTRDAHIRYHTGDRPYACKLCPKKYITASHLKIHMKANHLNSERKIHSCYICSREFVEVTALKLHILTHNRDKPPSC